MTKTSIPQMTIHNVETGEITSRPFNEDELAQLEIEKANAEARASAEATKAAQRQLLLNRLGITKEEAQLLLGGN